VNDDQLEHQEPVIGLCQSSVVEVVGKVLYAAVLCDLTDFCKSGWYINATFSPTVRSVDCMHCHPHTLTHTHTHTGGLDDFGSALTAAAEAKSNRAQQAQQMALQQRASSSESSSFSGAGVGRRQSELESMGSLQHKGA